MQISEDKRCRRTKKAIKDALLELMQKKDISKITVSELSIHADVNRKTFYKHYTGIEHVLEGLEDDYVEKILSLLNDQSIILDIKDPYPFFSRLTHAIQCEENRFKILILSQEHFRIQEKIKLRLLSYFQNISSQISEVDEKTFLFFVNFISGGITSVYSEWITNPEASLPEDLSSMISTAICGASSALRTSSVPPQKNG